MKFYNVSDMGKFMDAVRGCEGAVCVRDSEGQWVDLKGFAQQAGKLQGLGLSLSALKQGELEVVAERRSDAGRLIRFMTQAAKSVA